MSPGRGCSDTATSPPTPRSRHHRRVPTFPLYHSSRKKPRRWPLVLRFIKGAIHTDIAIPVILHALWTAGVCWLDTVTHGHLDLPSSIVPSLSIVVGLMLVFRNQTSYDRFWQGNIHLTTVTTSIRNLTRSFLACSYGKSPLTPLEKADIERTVRILLALIYATKSHLRSEWGQQIPSLLSLIGAGSPQLASNRETASMSKAEYSDLLPIGTRTFEEQGLGLLQQLSVQVEAFIKRGYDRGWYHAPQASQLTVQLNQLVSSYGSMETIHLTPLPVAYLIHMRQVLALFGGVLPFALVGDMGWWAIPIVSFICFTLYGVEAIGVQLEDPFGYDRNDIKVDAIVEDLRVEVDVMLIDWKNGGEIFARVDT
ncbi:hypothetical protein K431DRAFT_318889 [Polychaeton citri CBS 116435]|uniref:Uncharacterized protein n=1 Tax=Polychaeton citri CBS 116435 TaxID=1314669 RepID=A0A9P4QD74_9PEZI|nr:hypothetical protein K431DRAFT_318889 [Polychaeton citri CBS 116435]